MNFEKSVGNNFTIYSPGKSEIGEIYFNPSATDEEIFFIPPEVFKSEKHALSYQGYTKDEIAETIAKCIEGLDSEIAYSLVYEAIGNSGKMPFKDAMSDHDRFIEIIKPFYTPGTQVIIEDDGDMLRRKGTIIEMKSENEILVQAKTIETLPLKRIYRLSEKKCRFCGKKLIHEKFDNTRDHYKYLCRDCEENFFSFEAVD